MGIGFFIISTLNLMTTMDAYSNLVSGFLFESVENELKNNDSRQDGSTRRGKLRTAICTKIIAAGEMGEEAIEPFSSIERFFQSGGEAGWASGTRFLLKNGPNVTDEGRISARELMNRGDEVFFRQGWFERVNFRIRRMIHANTEDTSSHGMIMWFRMKCIIMGRRINLAKKKSVSG